MWSLVILTKRFIQKRTGVYILQILCQEIKEEEGKAVEVGISLLVILVGHIDKKINSEMNTGVYILQGFWR